MRCESMNCGSVIEALEVADLENQPAVLAELHEFARLVHRRRDRFFEQHVDVVFQHGLGHFVVRRRRRGNDDGVDPPDQIPVVVDALDAQRLGDAVGPVFVRIDDANQVRCGQRGQFFRVPLALHADADDSRVYAH